MIVKPVNGIYASRLKRLRQKLRRKGIEGLLVTNIHNVRYLSGFSGSSGFLFITSNKNFFITDFRYKEQSDKEVEGWDVLIETGNRIKIIQNLSKKTGLKTLAFESSVSFEFYEKISRIGLNLIRSGSLPEKLREIKDSAEIYSIKQAVRRAEAAFIEVKPYIKKGVKEIAIARRLEEKLRKNGCRNIPFDTIVASGPNSAMPHARPTEKKLHKGDLVIVDWGGEADGYYSDMTRTVLLEGGQDLGKKKAIYQIVLEANKKAISHVSPGVLSRSVDDAGRSFIRRAGYSEFFGHGTGHGVGLQVHEAPRISWNKSERLRENMVFTIEPGIYVRGLGGVRIEDMVAVRPERPEILTGLPKELEIL